MLLVRKQKDNFAKHENVAEYIKKYEKESI